MLLRVRVCAAIKFTKSGGVDLQVHGHAVSATNSQTRVQSTDILDSAAERSVDVGGSSRFQLHFVVRDTGIGISTTQLANLFQSFSQVQHISGEYGGTGQ